jgi:hypothetical protein
MSSSSRCGKSTKSRWVRCKWSGVQPLDGSASSPSGPWTFVRWMLPARQTPGLYLRISKPYSHKTATSSEQDSSTLCSVADLVCGFSLSVLSVSGTAGGLCPRGETWVGWVQLAPGCMARVRIYVVRVCSNHSTEDHASVTQTDRSPPLYTR